MVTPEAKRNAVKHLHDTFGQSLRKLCILIGLNRSSWYYEPQPDSNEPIRKRLRELADERKRWGYRRLHYLLRREGFQINHKRTERLYREENLMPRVRKAQEDGLREPCCPATTGAEEPLLGDGFYERQSV